MTTRDERDWKKVRKVFLDAHPKGWFPGNFLSFDQIDDDPTYVNDDAVLSAIGITVLDSSGNAQCFCGYPGARWNSETRRFNCPKAGCGIYWMTLLATVHRFVATSSSRAMKSIRPAPASSKGSSYIYVH